MLEAAELRAQIRAMIKHARRNGRMSVVADLEAALRLTYQDAQCIKQKQPKTNTKVEPSFQVSKDILARDAHRNEQSKTRGYAVFHEAGGVIAIRRQI